MPVPPVPEMSPRPNTAHAWPGNRSTDTITSPQTSPDQISDTRLYDRVAELERLLQSGNRRPATTAPNLISTPQPPMPTIPSPAPPIVPSVPLATGSIGGSQGLNIPGTQFNSSWLSGGPNIPFYNQNGATGIRGLSAPPSLLYQPPPPPYVDRDDIMKDFSLYSPQEYQSQEARLYQRIMYHSKVRLGLAKAISVLQREMEGGTTYRQLIRPYQIDQPENVPLLSPLIPNSEARLFQDTIRALVDILGLQRSLQVLEAAKVDDVPGIHYEIQRVMIPSRATPIPLEPPPEIIRDPHKAPDIGPFARSRTNSAASVASSAFTNFSWNADSSLPNTSVDDGPAPLTRPPSPPKNEGHAPRDGLISPPPVVAAPQRGILRRSASGSLLSGKRVTIQTDVPTSSLHNGQMCASPTTAAPNPILLPGAITPPSLDKDLPLQLQALNLSTDHGISSHQRRQGNSRSARPDDDMVMQMMAAAQM